LCGIAGLIGPPTPGQTPRGAILEAMAGCLEHRGPDAGGVLEDGPVGLAHRRLAVVGLGEGGAQPMWSGSGRYAVVYNGEVYNHPGIRRELEAAGRAPTWRGSSDTETLLAGVDAWGLERLLARTVGMFALALWDREERRLTLARDRMGEKPLTWTLSDGRLLFASQPSALRAVPGFSPSIDPDALADLLRYAQVPGERTIHRGVHQLLPGHLLEVEVEPDGRLRSEPRSRPWWSFLDVARSSVADPLRIPAAEQVELVAQAVTESVRGQLLSEVPLGAFLSGGIDSSLVVATMQQLSSQPVRTFTIGFAEPAYDESSHARAVAEHLGTAHTELMVTASEAQAVIPELPHAYDEPFADVSQIPTLLVSRLARREVTVALSGDGGDELFSGYERYARAVRYARVPRPLALGAAAFYGLRGDRRKRSASLALGRGPGPIVRRMLSANPDAEALVLGLDGATNLTRFASEWRRTTGLGGLRERFMALDTIGYLPDDILHKVDRAAMAVSLETRVPLLDHRLVALAWRLSPDVRVRDGVGKWALWEVLARHVPRHLFERPKAGFGVPIGRWLRGPLRPWAEDLLDPDALRREGLLDVEGVRGLWDAHLRSSSDDAYELWPVLMFRAWAEAR
jgi:asparagine synthase (glutamine-hydrolysing)